MATLASGKLSELFEDFLKSVTDRGGNSVYRSKISQLISNEGKSLVVDFGDLLRYNNDLANRVLLEPDSSLASFKIAAFETMRSENALYADRVKRELTVRLRGLPDLVPLRKVDTSHIDHMLAISGMVVRTSELRPMMTEGAWLCPSGHLTYQEQDDLPLKRPPKCELCGETRNFELDKRHSRFIDFQIVRVQELPEELPPGQLPQFFDVNMEGDIVNMARPGDRVVLTGMVRAVPDYSLGQVKTRLFRSQIDCNYAEVKGKEQEQVQVTKEDEELIKKIAASPDAYERLVSSIAPVIIGHQSEKEAILLLLAGGSATVLPDGTKLRGDINVLFVGDPGCLVADERIVLGNGAVAKIGEVGTTHLQPLGLQILTGEGGGKRAIAERFHVYRRQPILEIITESGKSIKGTYNHPLMVIGNDDGRPVRVWKRLDEMEVGDRIAATTFIPCTITGYRPTGFEIFQAKYGPRFKGRLPPAVNEDLGGYIGYLLGDGFVDRYSAVATIAEPEIDLLPRLEGMIKRLFGLEPRTTKRLRADRNVPMTDLYLNSECVARNLAFLRERRVPSLILESGNKVVSEFLRWLFEADGTVFSKGRGRRAVGLKAKDIELLRDVQVLLLRWGIHSRIVGNALLIRRGEDIVKFANHIGFVSRKKSSKLELLAEEAKKFGRVHEQRSERVVGVYRRPPEDVYDIEVPEGHRFIANGLISHNTGKSEMLRFSSQVAPRGLYASGRGTTAAGLSAAVIREKNVLMLEAGVVVLADQGIACLHPKSRIVYNDRIMSIGELAEQVKFVGIVSGSGTQEIGLVSGQLPSLDEADYRMKVNSATKVRRRLHSGFLLSIALKSGNRLLLTDDHLLLDGDGLEWKPAGKFVAGEFVLAPMRVPPPAYDELYLWDILPDSCVVSLTAEQKASLRVLLEGKYKTLARAGRETGVPRVASYFRNRLQPTLLELRIVTSALGVEGEWKRQFYTYDSCYVASATLTPQLAYLCGFVRGDATVRISKRRASMVVTQSPRHQAYIDRFREYWEQIFGPLSFRRRASECNIRGTGFEGERIDWSVGKRVFGHIYEYVAEGSLANILTLPDSVLRGLVAGLTDAGGCHGKKSSMKSGKSYETWNVTYEISSDDATNLNFLLALKRFGVVGSYRGVKKGVGTVVISSRSDVLRLHEELKEYSVKMQKVPSNRKHFVSGISEKLPLRLVQKLFKEAFDGRRTTELGQEGISSTVYGYKNMVRQPSVGQVLKVIERHVDIPQETLNKLAGLLRKDYYLDEIVEIEEVPYEGYVYDLVMEGSPNFVADGTIVHNCIDEFEKMKPEDRTALHEMMEQHTVTIAKGGIYATLNARTAILAACNPVLGRYNPFQNLTENIGTLPIPLLSVGPDEQVLVRVGGIVESRKIGEFVDSFYSPGEEGYPMYVEPASIDVASMDENLKVSWQPLRYVFRHESNADTYRITFKGRRLVITGGHSVYTFENGRLTLKPASKLQAGDYVAISKRLPVQGVLTKSFDVLKHVSLEGCYLHEVPTNAYNRLGGVPSYQIRRRALGAERYIELDESEVAHVTLSRKGSGFYVPARVPVGAELFRLLGYFVAEGAMVFNRSEGVYAVDFTFDRVKDRKLVSDLISISEALFKVRPTVTPDRNSVKVDIRSRIVVEFLRNCLGLKSGASEKRIPDLVFNAPSDLQWEFIEAYYAGDAGVTTSQELASQLLQLFGQLGHVASIFETPAHEAVIQGRRVKAATSYLVPVPSTGPQSNNGLSYPPLSQVIPLLKPILGEFAPTRSIRRVLTPKYWNELRNAIWVRNKIVKLSEVHRRPDTVGNLARRFAITEGSCSEFVTRMIGQGLVRKDRVATSSGRQVLCSLTSRGEEILDMVSYLDKVVAGDVAFVKIVRTEKLEGLDLPRYVYDLSVPNSENFVADTAICHNTRFDLIFVFRDQPTPVEDEKLASHILAVHARKSYATPPPIEFGLLKKYLAYVKRVSPSLTKEAMERLKDYYLQLRRGSGTEDSIPPTPRTLEALIRIATARARILLRDEVTGEDALAAIALMNRMVEEVLTDAATKKTDFGIQLGKPVGETKNLRAAMEVLKSLEGAEKKPVERKIFKEELMKAKFSEEDSEKMIRTMFREGMVYESKPGFIRRLGT